jgi:hypothetical protein
MISGDVQLRRDDPIALTSAAFLATTLIVRGISTNGTRRRRYRDLPRSASAVIVLGAGTVMGLHGRYGEPARRRSARAIQAVSSAR